MTDNFRLTNNIKPIHYHIIIKPQLDIFGGICYITYKKTTMENYIILNGVNLKITDATIPNCKCIDIIYDSKYERIKFVFDNLPDLGTIKISYLGQISDNMIGVYKSTRDSETIISTQFEPLFARYCFPCFDEPHFKATFQLEIYTPKNKTVLSNTHKISQKDDDNYTLHTFAITPKMSTYIVAFYIGSDDYIESNYNDIKIRIYSYNDPKYSEYALDVATKCLKFMTEYFEIEYPLNKLDLITVPKFASGAMENWGLIIFRESSLLCDETMTLVDKMGIANVICHEIAHQWFGNLVTMEWWSDLWLNESFATWMSWETLDNLYPDWHVWEHYYKSETLKAFNLDAMENSHPIANDIIEPHNINDAFDGISYAKGSNIIRLIIKLIGSETFRNGINHYLKKYSYANATTDDLWKCLEISSQKSVKEMMYNWLNKKNYPLLCVNYYGNDNLEITQEVFSGDETNICWVIPVTDNIILNDTKMIIAKNDINTKINKNIWGFYRICYGNDVLLKVLTDRFETLSVIDLSGILADLFALLKINKIQLSHYAKCLKIIVNNISDIDVGSIQLFLHIVFDHFIYAKHTNNAIIIDMFNNIMTEPVTKWGKYFEKSLSGDINTICGKKIIFNFMCEMELPLAIQHCKKFVNDFFDSDKFTMDSLTIIACVTLIQKDNMIFDKLIKMLGSNDDIIYILGYTNDLQRYIWALDLINSDQISDQDRDNLFVTAAQNSKLNKHLFPYMKSNWEIIWKIFKNNHFGLIDVVNSMGYSVDDGNLISDITIFFADKPIVKNAVKKSLERIKNNTQFSHIQ